MTTISASSYYNQWIHVAFVRVEDTLFAFINGAPLYSAPTTTDLEPKVLGIGVERVANGSYSASTHFSGFVSDFRISSSARYTDLSFTPPSARASPDSDTVLLITSPDNSHIATDTTDTDPWSMDSNAGWWAGSPFS